MPGQETIQAVKTEIAAQLSAARPSGSQTTPPSQTANYIFGGGISLVGVAIAAIGAEVLLKQGVSAWLTIIPLGLGVVVMLMGASVADERVSKIVDRFVTQIKGFMPGKSTTP